MNAIRGATTILCDTPEEIRVATKELLDEICKVNNLSKRDLICIMFSTTADIKSFYPAKAARECGYSFCALYSSAEPEIEGSLPLCIRVMILVEGKFKKRDVYLRAAKTLRRDLSQILNIAVDGPAGSGKSTVCKLVAERLGILYLDTGAMYRAIAYKCICGKADYADKDSVKFVLDNLKLEVEYKDGSQVTRLDGEDVSALIRSPQVSLVSSYVSSYPFVRTKMVDMQRKIAMNTSCILDGRDIGTNVLPDCDFKFYLTASAEIRAKRRYDEDIAKGLSVTYEAVLKDINERDFHDKNRAVAPLKRAADAVEIDTSDLTAEQVADEILNKIQEKI